MPYPYSYFKPTGKEQAAMAIGSLLAGALAAAQPRQEGEASPALKGITGAVAGYGSGYKTYQDMMGDAWQRDLHDKKFGQDVNQFDQQMGLGRDKFNEEIRQYKESELPYKQSLTNYNNQRTEFPSKPVYPPGEEERASFENTHNLSILPAAVLAELRKTPEYLEGFNNYRNKNSMAEPYIYDPKPKEVSKGEGLWGSVKNMFNSTTPPEEVNNITKSKEWYKWR